MEPARGRPGRHRRGPFPAPDRDAPAFTVDVPVGVPTDVHRTWIEFNYASAFFDVVKAIQLAGKRVILANLSELSAALLEAMGVNRYAILVRRKSS